MVKNVKIWVETGDFFGIGMGEIDAKTQNLMGIFANIIEQIPHDQLNELVQASLQEATSDKKSHSSK